ncbi:MAG TPA: hypothetical protein VLA91_04930 [Acidimicrobiia bacterium]|nr:hypothetical protein [Acidimicrobiia bacterium]
MRQSMFRVWAAVWSIVIGVTFLGVTVLTLALWLTDPGYTETTPVGDLSFFALGAIIGVGLACQLRRAEQRIAGLQQAGIGILSLGGAGVIGARIEPAIGAVLLLLVVAVLVGLHPARREIFAPGPGIDVPVLALSVLAGVPAIGYAVSMLDLAVEAGPSCFLGQCARGDRFAEMAAATIAIVLAGGLAGFRTPGWRLPLWSAGAGAILIGSTSIAISDATGSLGLGWGSLAVIWGVLLIVIGERRGRHRPPPTTALFEEGDVLTPSRGPGSRSGSV